eukprot:gene34-166_t
MAEYTTSSIGPSASQVNVLTENTNESEQFTKLGRDYAIHHDISRLPDFVVKTAEGLSPGISEKRSTPTQSSPDTKISTNITDSFAKESRALIEKSENFMRKMSVPRFESDQRPSASSHLPASPPTFSPQFYPKERYSSSVDNNRPTFNSQRERPTSPLSQRPEVKRLTANLVHSPVFRANDFDKKPYQRERDRVTNEEDSQLFERIQKLRRETAGEYRQLVKDSSSPVRQKFSPQIRPMGLTHKISPTESASLALSSPPPLQPYDKALPPSHMDRELDRLRSISPVNRRGRLGSSRPHSPNIHSVSPSRRVQMTPSTVSPITNLPLRQAVCPREDIWGDRPLKLSGALKLGNKQLPNPFSDSRDDFNSRSRSRAAEMPNPFRRQKSRSRSASPNPRNNEPELQSVSSHVPINNSDRYTPSQIESGKHVNMKVKLRAQQHEINSLKTALQNLWQQTQRSPPLPGWGRVEPCVSEFTPTEEELESSSRLTHRRASASAKSRSPSPRKKGAWDPPPRSPPPGARITWGDLPEYSERKKSRSRSPVKGGRSPSPKPHPVKPNNPSYSFARHTYSPEKRWASECTYDEKFKISPSHRRATSRAAIHSSGQGTSAFYDALRNTPSCQELLLESRLNESPPRCLSTKPLILTEYSSSNDSVQDESNVPTETKIDKEVSSTDTDALLQPDYASVDKSNTMTSGNPKNNLTTSSVTQSICLDEDTDSLYARSTFTLPDNSLQNKQSWSFNHVVPVRSRSNSPKKEVEVKQRSLRQEVAITNQRIANKLKMRKQYIDDFFTGMQLDKNLYVKHRKWRKASERKNFVPHLNSNRPHFFVPKRRSLITAGDKVRCQHDRSSLQRWREECEKSDKAYADAQIQLQRFRNRTPLPWTINSSPLGSKDWKVNREAQGEVAHRFLRAHAMQNDMSSQYRNVSPESRTTDIRSPQDILRMRARTL